MMTARNKEHSDAKAGRNLAWNRLVGHPLGRLEKNIEKLVPCGAVYLLPSFVMQMCNHLLAEIRSRKYDLVRLYPPPEATKSQSRSVQSSALLDFWTADIGSCC
jgi:hypothetical protein